MTSSSVTIEAALSVCGQLPTTIVQRIPVVPGSSANLVAAEVQYVRRYSNKSGIGVVLKTASDVVILSARSSGLIRYVN